MPLTKLILIDGHSLAYWAFYGLPLYDRGGKVHFTNARGEFTHAVYGFCNMLLKVWDDERPDGIDVARVAGDSDAATLAYRMLGERRMDVYAIMAYNHREQEGHHDSLPRIQA